MKTPRPVAAALAIVVGAGLLLTPTSVLAGADQDLYARGRDAVFAEKWSEARDAFEDLIRRQPGSAYADDAHYWLGMAYYESREPERGYSILKQLQSRFPDSPWNDDGRALMVRCAEAALVAGARSGSSGRGSPSPLNIGADASRRAEYESFLRQSTSDSSSKVQLLAIDTVLETRPEMAPELLPRLNNGRASKEAAGMVMDRFFRDARVKILMEQPGLGFTEGNVAVMVRSNDTVSQLTLTEALDLVGPGGRASRRFDPATLDEMREKLVKAERGLIEPGGPGTVESAPDDHSRTAIVKVVDGEVHYYRNGDETTRIVVLRREAGFDPSNVRVFVENREGIREVPLKEARILAPGGRFALSEPTVRYLKAALAIIEIDLNRTSGAPAGGSD